MHSRWVLALAASGSVLSATPALAEMTPRQIQVIERAATICADVVSGKVGDPADHEQRGDFSWNAEVGMWHWFVGADQVAIRRVVSRGIIFCDVIVVAPRASDADVRNAALSFSRPRGYRVSEGIEEGELMLGSGAGALFAVRKMAQGWRIDFEP